MKSKPPMSCLFVALLFVLSVCNCSTASTCPLLLASGAADSDKTGYHIAVLKDGTSHERFEDIKSKVVSMTEDKEVHGSVETVVKAFTVKLSDHALSTVRSLPEVEYVEEETMAHIAQEETVVKAFTVKMSDHALSTVQSLPDLEDEYVEDDFVIWHVDRLDQYYLPLDNIYQPNGTGDGVDIYILDTGVYYDHEEFEGRAEYGGYDPTDVANNQNFRGSDCTGHGTHVASLAAGKMYGTAKKARIYSIRVLGCCNSGRTTTIIEGLDYCSRIIPKRGRPALVSMSLSSWYSWTLDRAIKRLHDQNITVVASAGNAFSNACEFSPAGSANVITVAGSAWNDEIYSFTNFGPCVDIFAPASMIEAADYRCVSCSRYDSGTSMAAPKVSGVAAIHLEKDPTLTPDQMKTKLVSAATPDVLDFSDLPYDDHLSTANRLLYIGPSVSLDCEEIPDVTNGNVSITGLTPGSVATYSCASDYNVKGSQDRTCNFLGKWSHYEPKCVKSCPELPWNIPDGELSGDNEQPVENSTVNYHCYYGYVLVGDDVRICQANGTWSGEQPTCVKTSTCPQLHWNIPNGYLYGDFYPPVKGSTVYYRCYYGNSLLGDHVRICQANGTWSGEQPTCVRKVTCPQLTWNVTNGYLSGRWYEPMEASIVYYYCNYKYSLLGDHVRICQANGTWSGEQPTCVRKVTCPEFPWYISNGRVFGNHHTPVKDSTLYYYCYYGYSLHGDHIRICQANGTWSGEQPTCVRTSTCPELTWNITNGELRGNFYEPVEGSTVYYYCPYGYSLLGDHVRICQANGTWSGEQPTCVRKMTCPKLTWNVTNGYLSGTYYRPDEGSTAYYRCYYGYSLLGEDVRICQANGTWSGEQPTCVWTWTCPELNWNDTNGDLLGDYYQSIEGSMAYYYCSYGYSLLGDHVRTCQANGTWSGEQPTCIAQCPELSPIANGNITGHLGNRTVGTIVTYACIDGYALVGSQHRICQSDQTWSGLKPSCVLVPLAPKIQALCSVVVWNSPEVPNYGNNITDYDVRLYAHSSQLPERNITRQVGSNGTFYIISDEDNLGNGDETYVQVRAVSVYGVAGKWSEGISLGCDRPTVSETPSVYFELNEKIYHNNSVVLITSIGEAGSALFCNTDKNDCCKTIPNRYGEFYYPNGTQVPIQFYEYGFYRNRDRQLIRLNRRELTTSPRGKYRCEIPDASGEMKNIYIDLI